MKQKTRKIHKVLLLPLLIAVMLFPMYVFAAEYSCSVMIPVEVQVKGDSVPSGNEYTLILEKVEEEPDNPMPEETELVIKDGGKAEFGPVTYVRPDDYHYTIRQKIGNAEHFTYDDTVFTVTVRVVNAQDGGLEAEIWAIKDNAEKKTDAIRFENRYEKPSKPGHYPDYEPEEHPREEEVVSVVPTVIPAAPDPVAEPVPDQGTQLQPGTQTGDSAYLVLWAALLVIAALVLMIIFLNRKKNEYAEE